MVTVGDILAGPDQYLAAFIDGQAPGDDEFMANVVEGLFVETEFAPQTAIGDPAVEGQQTGDPNERLRKRSGFCQIPPPGIPDQAYPVPPRPNTDSFVKFEPAITIEALIRVNRGSSVSPG